MWKKQIGIEIIGRASSIKFLELMLDENLSGKDHIETVKNNLAKNVGSLYHTE